MAMAQEWRATTRVGPASVRARLRKAVASLRLAQERYHGAHPLQASTEFQQCVGSGMSPDGCGDEGDADGRAAPAAPAVTVLLPVHNHARFLGTSLPPLLDEAARGVAELVLLDDGSTDDIGQWLRAAAGSPGVRILRGRLGSLPRALNGLSCLADPLSEAWTWTSADNTGYAGLYQGLWEGMQGPVGAARGLGWANFRAIDDAGRPHPSVRWWQGRYVAPGDSRLAYPATPDEMLRTGENLVGPVFLARAGPARAALPYDTGVEGIEDFDMWLRLLSVLPGGGIDDGGRHAYEYRVHAATLTESLDKPQVYARLLAMRAFEPIRQAVGKRPCAVAASAAARRVLRSWLRDAGDDGADASDDDVDASLGIGQRRWAGRTPGGGAVELVAPEDLTDPDAPPVPLLRREGQPPRGGILASFPSLGQPKDDHAARLPPPQPRGPTTGDIDAAAAAGCLSLDAPDRASGAPGAAGSPGAADYAPCRIRVLVLPPLASPDAVHSALASSRGRVHAAWVPRLPPSAPAAALAARRDAVLRARLYHRIVLDGAPTPAAADGTAPAWNGSGAPARLGSASPASRSIMAPHSAPCLACNLRRAAFHLGQPPLPDRPPPSPWSPVPLELAARPTDPALSLGLTPDGAPCPWAGALAVCFGSGSGAGEPARVEVVIADTSAGAADVAPRPPSRTVPRGGPGWHQQEQPPLELQVAVVTGSGEGAVGDRLGALLRGCDAIIAATPGAARAAEAVAGRPGKIVPAFAARREARPLSPILEAVAAWLLQGGPPRSMAAWVHDYAL